MSQLNQPSGATGLTGGQYVKLNDGSYQPTGDISGNGLEYRGGTIATIATTGNSDAYVIAPFASTVDTGTFSGTDALAASDTNYITFTVTNLGQAGAGTNPLLAATDANTTKVTGGTAISANTKRMLTMNGTTANLTVAAGDRLRIRAAATGTLANTVTGAVFIFRFTPILPS